MQIKNDYYKITFNDKNGNILSYINNKGINYLTEYGVEPLFTIRLMDENGGVIDVKSDFGTNLLVREENGLTNFVYKGVGGYDLNAVVTVKYDDTPFIRWNLKLENNTGYSVMWEQFPGMMLDCKLPTRNGKHKLFLPILEGVEIEDYSLRNKHMIYFDPCYPSKGWTGDYPGPVSLQFLGMYDGDDGIYIGMHDDTFQSKHIDAFEEWNGIRVSTKYLPGTEASEIEMPFDTVTGFFQGGFYDLAEIYRKFVERSKLIPQIKDKAEWLEKPPVVVIYPIRGEKDTGDLSETEYYPYTNALPYLDKLKETLGERIMVLLCHWEGTAPWCPPYVWPPYGDKRNFDEFIYELHKRGDLFGLYCSGIGWTEKAIWYDYSAEGKLSEEELMQTMCIAPDGTLPYAHILNGLIRWGYEMCPATQNAKDIMKGEFEKIKQSGVDYVQLFDQNLGGNSSMCFGKNHGHPHTPGKWQTLAMRDLIKNIKENSSVVIGCEGAASEGFNDLLPFSDGRNNMGFAMGTPVPAYVYVYHEYLANFYGNQITSYSYLDAAENPNELLYRTAHLFAQGEAITVVLRDKGKINWDWGTPWSVNEPNQLNQLTLLKNLVDWKKSKVMQRELCRGRMAKPFSIKCGVFNMLHRDGKKLRYPSVITRAYFSADRKKQIFINPFDLEQSIEFEEICGMIYDNPDAKGKSFVGSKLTIQPFSVNVLEY